MWMVFKNILQGIKKRPIQLTGIIVLVMLSVATYVTMSDSSANLLASYYEYSEEQNQEHLQFRYNLKYNDMTSEEKALLDDKLPSEIQNITSISEKLNAINLWVNSTENGQSVTKVIMENRNQELTENYDITIQSSFTKYITDKDSEHIFMFMENRQSINLPYLVDGELPINENEIAIFNTYGKANNIGVGDKLKLSYEYTKEYDSVTGKPVTDAEIVEYTVTAYVYLPDYIMPLINRNSMIPNTSVETAVLMSSQSYEQLKVMEDRKYSAVFNDGFTDDKITEFENDKEDNLISFVMSKDGNPRIFMITQNADNNEMFAAVFAVLVAGLSLVVIGLMLKKRIENDGQQLGVLKSLGYNNRNITVAYLAYPLVATVIGGLLGYALGSGLSYMMTRMFADVYLLPLGGFRINFKTLLHGPILIGLIINLFSLIVICILLKTPAIDLLKPGNKMDNEITFPKIVDKKITVTLINIVLLLPRLAWYITTKIYNIIKKIVLKIAKQLGFITSFKFSLAFRSPAKLIVIFLTIFISSMLTYLSLTGLTLFSDLVDDSFDSFNFNYNVDYYGEITDDYDNEREDILYYGWIDVVEINDKDMSDKDIRIGLNGIEKNPTISPVLDKNGNNISYKASEGLIISDLMKAVYRIDVGDEITVAVERIVLDDSGNPIEKCVETYTDGTCLEIDYEYETYTKKIPVVASNNEMISSVAYYDIDKTRELFNAKEGSYNSKYMLDEPQPDNRIVVILSLDDIKASMEEMVDQMQTTISVIIVFTAILSLVIIAVMTNFTIEENFKNISLLKVMGYGKKEISKMVLRIYGPIIIFASVVGYPVLIALLRFGFYLLAEEFGISIPVKFSLLNWAIGTGAITVAYTISLQVSKRSLKRISLQEALKED